MGDFETIELETFRRIATITLNRPTHLNALNEQMFLELTVALEQVAQDSEVRVLILTGAGKAFCASADIEEERRDGDSLMGHLSPQAILEFIEQRPHPMIQRLFSLNKPTIAMVNGLAIGDGFDLSLACDIRIGSEKARFMNAFLQMGLVSSTGSTWLYPRVMGVGKAFELLFTGDWLYADEAYRVGVLNRLVAHEDLVCATMELAERISVRAPIANRFVKSLVHRGFSQTLSEHLSDAAAMEVLTLTTADHREALSSFLEKREPDFHDK